MSWKALLLLLLLSLLLLIIEGLQIRLHTNLQVSNTAFT